MSQDAPKSCRVVILVALPVEYQVIRRSLQGLQEMVLLSGMISRCSDEAFAKQLA